MNRISRLYVFTALVCLGGCASSGGSSGAPEPPRDEAPQMVSRGVPPALRVPVTASGRASVRVTIEVLIDETGLPDMSTFKVTGKTNSFAHSFVIASNFRNVSIASIDPDNGGTKFGIVADNAVKALSAANGTTKFTYNAKTPGTQDFNGTDFEVKIV